MSNENQTNSSTAPKSILVRIHSDNYKALSVEERLVILRWKTPKSEKSNLTYKKTPDYSLSVPICAVGTNIPVLKNALQNAFNELQEQAIREVVTDYLEKPGTNKASFTIFHHEVDFIAVAAWADKKAASGHLTKEILGTWFDEAIQDNLYLAICDKLQITNEPTPEQTLQVSAAVKHRKELICDLASPKASMPLKVAEQLIKVIDLAATDSDATIQAKLKTKLQTFLKVQQELEVNL